MYDKNMDGRIHKIEMWVMQSQEWDKRREFLIKEATKKAEFNPAWFKYDADRDWKVTLEEILYVRAGIETATESLLFFDHYKSKEEVTTLDTISYDDAFGVWTLDHDAKDDFNRNWKIADSDQDGQITIDDIYAVVGVIPGLKKEDVNKIWRDINTDPDEICYYEEACSSVVNSWMCTDDYENISSYIRWKDNFYPELLDADTNSDGQISVEELKTALEDAEDEKIS